MKRLSLVLVSLLLLSTSSCSLFSIFQKVTIQDVAWYIETIAPDRWADSVIDKPSLSYSFEVYFKEALTLNDIETARVYLPNSSSYWTLNPDTTLDTEHKSIGYGVRYWLSVNNDELPIGTLTAEIVLSNGKSDQYTFTMGKPGSTSTGGYSYVYSSQDEVTHTYPGASTPALMRPEVTNLTRDGVMNLEITFKIRGNNVRNGWIWFYDSLDQYIGRSKFFYNQKDGSSNIIFFNTAPDAVNKMTCPTYGIIKNDGSFATEAERDRVAHCRLYVTDGAQYVGQNEVQYDYRAMSAYY